MNLDPKIRQTVSLVALAAANQHDLLRIHIDIARKLGFTKQELSEVFQQMAPFTGFPLASLTVATNGFVNACFTVAICPPPLVAAMEKAGPAVFVSGN